MRPRPVPKTSSAQDGQLCAELGLVQATLAKSASRITPSILPSILRIRLVLAASLGQTPIYRGSFPARSGFMGLNARGSRRQSPRGAWPLIGIDAQAP